MKKNINFNLLKKLKIAAESKDFQTASLKLATTGGALSIQIDQLEKAIGREVFIRKNNRKTTDLNEDGKQIYELFSLLCKKIESFEYIPKKKKYNITIVTTTGLSNYIFSKITELIKKNEEFFKINVEIAPEQNLIINEDFLIRSDISFMENVNIEKLLELQFGLYATKEYLKFKGIPKILQDLENHNILSTRSFFHYDSYNKEPLYLKLNSIYPTTFTCDDINTLVLLCKKHLGILELPIDYPGIENLIKIELSDYYLTTMVYVGYKESVKYDSEKMLFLKDLKNIFRGEKCF